MTFKYTLGADPEVFVRDATTKLIVPVCGKVGGTKEHPVQFVSGSGPFEDFKYQEDNVTFEVNIPAVTNKSNFCRAIERVVSLSKGLLASKGLVPDYNRSAVRFSTKELDSPQAQTIGCDPDMCAYGGIDDAPRAREPFDIKDLGTWRYAGGHIHLGYDPALGIPAHVVVRLMDACVYLPTIEKDKQKSRRHKYGLAGLYRDKPYGVEYRTMSNFWMADPGYVARASFNLLYDLHNNLEALHEFYQKLPIEEVQKCVDSGGQLAGSLRAKITALPKFYGLNISENFNPRRSLHTILDEFVMPAEG